MIIRTKYNSDQNVQNHSNLIEKAFFSDKNKLRMNKHNDMLN